MNHNWEYKKLSSVCSKIGDGLHGTPIYAHDGEYFFVNGNNLKNGSIHVTNDTKRVGKDEGERHKVALNDSTLLLSINGTIGEMALYRGEPIILGKSAAYINCSKVDRRFCYYYFCLRGVQTAFYNIATGSTIKNLGLDALKNFLIPVPPETIQHKVVELLSTLDAKIALNRRLNAELEAMAKLLYDYWFVQFDFPISAAQAAAMGRPDLKGKPYRTSGGKMVHHAELKREIPEGWEAGTLGQIVKVTRGVTYGKEDVLPPHHPDAIPILRATNVTNSNLDLDNMVYVKEKFVRNDQLIGQFENLVVMSSGSKEHVGKSAPMYHTDDVGFGAFCSKVTASCDATYFVMIYLQSDMYKKRIKNLCLGTNINNLTEEHIVGQIIAFPASDHLKKFETIVTPIFGKIRNQHVQSRYLTQLRDWLLPMLMNGQVTVGDPAAKQEGIIRNPTG